MNTTSSPARPTARRRLAAAGLSFALVAGFAAAGTSSASAATRKAKPKARIAVAHKSVTTPVAVPSAALTPAPAWQYSG
jgi:putative effector of murein hydrolase